MAQYHRDLMALYNRLAALDLRAAKLEVFAKEQANIDAERKEILDVMTSMPLPADTSTDAIPSGIPIPPAQPPV
jgi:hypothetical protein